MKPGQNRKGQVTDSGKKYDELVCTAGILDDGQWVRIYPLPFRKADYDKRYKKFQWVELPLSKNKNDKRPESYKVDDLSQVKVGAEVGTQRGWADRTAIILDKNRLYTNLTELIGLAHQNRLSLACFQPTKLLDFVVEKCSREWDQDKLDILKEKSKQYSLFQPENEVIEQFNIVDKLPYKFSYKFEDDSGKISTLMIEDWEIGMLYWNCLGRNNGDEKKAVEQVRQKYFTEFKNKDLKFFLGTTKQFHFKNAPNPFVIIGVYYPPGEAQGSLF